MANGIGNLPTPPTPEAHASHVTVVDQLRAPDLTVASFAPRAALGTTPLKPRPAPPERPLTARPLPRGLHIPTAPYGAPSFTRADLNRALAAEGLQPVGTGEPHAWKAFRDELTGGSR